MANHVWNNVQLYTSDGKPLDVFSPLTDKEVMLDNAHEVLNFLGVDLPDEDTVNTRDWYIDNIGAKWCSIEDIGENYLALNSAWCPPTELVVNMVKALSEQYPDCYGTITYEDEAYCFVGSALITKDGIDEMNELDTDDILEQFNEQQELEGEPTAEELNDVFEEELTDNFYDFIMTRLSLNLDEMVDCYLEYIAEENS